MVGPALLLVVALLGAAAYAAQPLPASTHATLLTDAQWENTVRDLLRLPEVPGLSQGFPATPAASGADFGRTAASLMVATSSRWEAYRFAAEVLAKRITDDPAALARILPAGARQGDVGTRVRYFVDDFLPRAYRRAVGDEEVLAVVNLSEHAPAWGPDPFLARVRWILTAVLQTPSFLYRIEGGSADAENGRSRLTSDEVATKLSYALWNTMPDEQLRRYATSGRLATRAGVRAVAAEMLHDRRSTPVLMDFHDQFFEVDRYDGLVRQKSEFPTFYARFGTDAQQDVRLTIRELVVDHPGGLRDLYSSDVAYVNANLAKVYGVRTGGLSGPDPDPDMFVRVRMPDSRAGILTHVGWLAVNADAQDPSPIQRGVFVARRALCLPLGNPPAGASATRIERQPGSTNRGRVETTTERAPACSACHARVINPVGFAFEAFDALGAYRTNDGASTVDTTGATGLLGTFDGARALLRSVSQTPNAHACYAAHWVAYLNGTPKVDARAEWLSPVVSRSLKGAPVRDVIAQIVESDAFLTVSR